jgi:hypothetical protein
MASEIELAYFSRSNGVSFILFHDDDLLRRLAGGGGFRKLVTKIFATEWVLPKS